MRLTVSADVLEHPRECITAQQMLDYINNVFCTPIFLNKVRARREFYTVQINQN